MRRYELFDGLSAPETLELKLSPTAVSVAAVMASPTGAALQISQTAHYALPRPEPLPRLCAAEDPIEYPILPPSGPGGPGS
jgi:hypothetical protein